MNIVEEGLCLIREFDDKTDELLKYEEQEKQKVNELFAKAIIEFIKNVSSEAKHFNETFNMSIYDIEISKYINTSNLTAINCMMNEKSITITLYFRYISYGMFSGDENQKYYDTEIINELLKDVGINVNLEEEEKTINITFEREKVKVNKSSESEQTVQEPSASARILKP